MRHNDKFTCTVLFLIALKPALFAQAATVPMDRPRAQTSDMRAIPSVDQPSVTCVADRTSVIPGEPIHLRLDSAGAETLEMHTTAGQLTMKENEATVDTQGLKPG